MGRRRSVDRATEEASVSVPKGQHMRDAVYSPVMNPSEG